LPERGLHEPRARDVVGVTVRVERVQKLQPELADQRRVARVLLEDRVDEHGLTRALVGEEVAVRVGDLVEELSEDQCTPHDSSVEDGRIVVPVGASFSANGCGLDTGSPRSKLQTQPMARS
jgi:hypothetical protein